MFSESASSDVSPLPALCTYRIENRRPFVCTPQLLRPNVNLCEELDTVQERTCASFEYASMCPHSGHFSVTYINRACHYFPLTHRVARNRP